MIPLPSPIALRNIFAGLILLTAVGCSDSDITLPHVISGNEVPPEVLAEPRLVPVPPPADSDNAVWPRLGDVPSKPKNFTPQNLIDASKEQLEEERAVGDLLHQKYAPDLAAAAPSKTAAPTPLPPPP
jgi:hypothetical protein